MGISQKTWRRDFMLVATVLLLLGSPLLGFQKKKDKSTLDDLAFAQPQTHPFAQIVLDEAEARSLASPETWAAFDALLSTEHAQWSLLFDRASGVPNSLSGKGIPWIPGSGEDNFLTGASLGLPGDVSGKDVPVALVEKKAREFMMAYPRLFPASQGDLALNAAGSGPVLGYLYYLNFEWSWHGIPVENAHVTFTLNHGNLIEVDQEFISPALQALDATPTISAETAWQDTWGYLGQSGPDPSDRLIEPGRLLVTPVASPELLAGLPVTPGKGLGYRLVYVLLFHREGVMGNWEARVDAHSGEVLSFLDANAYGVVRGGTYKTDKPFSEQNVPFPFADYGGSSWADQGGNFPGSSGTSTLTGRTGSSGNVGAVDIVDNCGSISLGASGGVIDFSSSGGLDCTTPGVGGTGNTHAARTQYWNVAQIKIKAYTYLPGNTWLQSLLTDNVNLNQTCNAYWLSPTLNFFKSGGGCWNTGELPGVSLHEFGHGMDANDGNGSSPNGGSGEAYGDLTALMQTHSSCMGNGFMGGNCTGYGDTCTSCTGVRELDYAKHVSNAPSTPATFGGTTGYHCPTGACVGPCNYECHCESVVATQAVWDLATRDLITWGMDQATAWQLVDRLWYASRPSATSVYRCPSVTTTDGCAAGTIWRVFRAADDDDGNLNNGTPHMTALSAAFNRHAIACTTDAGYNTNSTTCPSIGGSVATATPGNATIYVNWTAATNAVNYLVYRNETGCEAGYTKVATIASPTTTYTDTLVANGITYCYRIQAQGSTAVCVGAMSPCASASPLNCTPLAAPSPVTATPNGTYRIDVSWSGVGGAVSYNVYRSTTSGGPWTLLTVTSSAVTSTSDTAVVGGRTYYYMVRTFSACESLNSAQASAAAGGTCNQPPTFAGLTSATNGLNASCRNVLTWSAATSNCSGTITYSVYRSSAAGFTPDAGTLIASGVAGTTYTDTGAAYKQTYSYIVRAVDSVSGSDSNTVTQSSYPTGARSTIYSNDFEANWTNWTNGSVMTPSATGPVTGIWIRGTPVATVNNYGTTGQPGSGHNGSTNCLFTAQNTGGTAGVDDVDYGEVWVRSPTFDGTASPSVQLDMWRWWLNDHTYTAPGCSYPDFYSLEVSNNGGTTWTVLESFDDNCSTMKGCGTNAWINAKYSLESYVSLTNNMSVRMRVCDGQNTPNGTGTCDGDLVEGALDDFYVYGYATCTACAAPALPTGLTATPNGANRIDLAWSGSANRYNIYRSEGSCPGGTFTQIAGNVLTTSYSDTAVSGGLTYSYKITGVSATYCESALTACANATGSGTCGLGPTFAGLTSATNSHSATCGIGLAWSAATQKCGTGVVYNVYRSTSSSLVPGDSTRIAKGVSGTSYNDTAGLVYGTTYSYVVRAEDNTTGGTGPNGGNEETNTVTKNAGPSGGQLTGSNIFFDNFDSGSGTTGWDAGYFSGNATDVRGRMACSPTHSGSNIFRWGGNGCTSNYANNVASLAAPLPNTYGIDIPFDATNVKMDFYHRYIFASGDGACLLIQKLPTSTYYFVQANALSGHVYNGTTGATNPIGSGAACWTGTFNSSMNLTTVDLDLVCQYIDGKTCAGSTLSIAFTGSSDTSGANYGWFLDDVRVYGDYGTTSCTTSGCAMLVEIAPGGTTTVGTGQDILFAANFTGGTPPYTYQWTEDGSNITGATAVSYAANKAAAGSHTYNCKVTDSSGRCANVQDTQAATGTWQSAAPPRVPYSVTPMRITGGCLAWDVVNCPSPGYHILYGRGENLPTLSGASPLIEGATCSIGTSGCIAPPVLPDPSSWAKRFLWFLIVGDNGSSTEGPWLDGGTEGSVASGQCGMTTKSTSGTCGIP